MGKAKNKGDNEERAVVNLHREWGLDCERTLERGVRMDGSPTWDIDLHLKDKTLRGECKCRESIGDWIWDHLGDSDFLTLRKNRKARLYVVPEHVWKGLIDGQA